MNINIAALLIGGVLLAATPIEAQTITAPNGDTLRAVRHADLDLDTRSGRAKLNRRIALALESVCGSYANRSIDEQDEVTRCRREANARLAPQLTRILSTHVPVQSAMLDR